MSGGAVDDFWRKRGVLGEKVALGVKIDLNFCAGLSNILAIREIAFCKHRN